LKKTLGKTQNILSTFFTIILGKEFLALIIQAQKKQ
jgi:hypothetical protein